MFNKYNIIVSSLNLISTLFICVRIILSLNNLLKLIISNKVLCTSKKFPRSFKWFCIKRGKERWLRQRICQVVEGQRREKRKEKKYTMSKLMKIMLPETEISLTLFFFLCSRRKLYCRRDIFSLTHLISFSLSIALSPSPSISLFRSAIRRVPLSSPQKYLSSVYLPVLRCYNIQTININ